MNRGTAESQAGSRTLGSFGELFSDMQAHVKKGICAVSNDVVEPCGAFWAPLENERGNQFGEGNRYGFGLPDLGGVTENLSLIYARLNKGPFICL